jgi:dihydroflavonol-4-reductase
MLGTAANAVGARPPRFGLPLAVAYAAAGLLQGVARLLRRDPPINVTGVRLLHIMSRADHGKATRELGWVPAPTADAIRRAARCYVERSTAR